MTSESNPAASEPSDIRPVVATGRGGQVGLWVFAAFIVVLGAWLFSAMSVRRETLSAPRTTAIAPDPSQRIASPPPMAYPLPYDQTYGPGEPLAEARPVVVAPAAPAPVVLRPLRPAPEPTRATPPAYAPPPPRYEPFPSPPQVGSNLGSAPAPLAASGGTASDAAGRVTAGRLANPSLTIPQGTVIPAVLETALDSTRPGGVRALVQHDINGFDGTRVLIQRGSRLYGEYDAQLESGQNRAMIRWTRLIRPDGVTIALDSPASDPLGRAGVKGKVDSKFFQRFGGALLQSILDIGVGVATQKATDGVIVALPGSTQNVTPRVDQSQGKPTLSVKHGTSVSVFVARDLDFSSVE